MSDRIQICPIMIQKVYLPLLGGIVMKDRIIFLEHLHLKIHGYIVPATQADIQ